MSPGESERRGLSRERLIAAALELVNEEGLEALSMRALADRLDVKASSLYWHVRDRDELLQLLAEAILEGVARPRRGAHWRANVLALAASLRTRVAAQKDARRILLEAPGALERSTTHADLEAQFRSAGLHPAEAGELARLAITYVIMASGSSEVSVVNRAPVDAPASLAVDTGSRGVFLRAGSEDMRDLVRIPQSRTSAAPALVRGETVVVRRLRGVGKGEIELTPLRAWTIKIQAPTWNTVLDAAALELREIHVDSGATRFECFLPRPVGVVPIHVSSGVVGVSLHRPPGTAISAIVHTGALKIQLDAFSTRVAVSDVHWQSGEGQPPADRYELDISSGAVNVTLDTYEPSREASRRAPRAPVVGSDAAKTDKPVSALEILLDGVEARTRARQHSAR